MARRTIYRELKTEINIVPFLDILLVLVLILIATVPVITQNFEVNLPHSAYSTTITNQDIPLVMIEVNGSNLYKIVVTNTNSQKQLFSTQIVSEVKTIIAANPQTAFLISGAKDIPYDKIIQMLNILSQAGVKSVGLMTQPISS